MNAQLRCHPELTPQRRGAPLAMLLEKYVHFGHSARGRPDETLDFETPAQCVAAPAIAADVQPWRLSRDERRPFCIGVKAGAKVTVAGPSKIQVPPVTLPRYACHDVVVGPTDRQVGLFERP